jgi:hypothetical protein
MKIAERRILKNTFFALLISGILDVVILLIAALPLFCKFFKLYFFIASSILALIVVFVSFKLLRGTKASVGTKFFNATGPFAAIIIIYFIALKFTDNIDNCNDCKISFTVVFESEQGNKLQSNKGDYAYFLLPGAANTYQAFINPNGSAFFNGIDCNFKNTVLNIKICDNMQTFYFQVDTTFKITDKAIYNVVLDLKPPPPPPPTTTTITITKKYFTGSVLSGGKPLVGATISYNGASCSTGKTGYFKLEVPINTPNQIQFQVKSPTGDIKIFTSSINNNTFKFN